ncbi:MAG TPA: YkgJ family cysteine cluster protein [Rariglobus sp.]|jgi:Fe-S-cluster containining protein|nr:YkgJ family cysteine cluster protein [Rariglobus sp.]
MCAAFSPEEETLFEKTGGAVLKRLRKTRNPADLLSVLGGARKEFERAFLSAPAEAKAAVACRAGCDACCHVPVGVQAHEVLIAAQHVQTHFSPVDLDELIARASAHREAFSGRSSLERLMLRTPCALLREGSCSIYEGRPEACRSHHSHSVEACRENLASGREDRDVYIAGVRGRMFAVMLAIDQAAAEAGFDGRAYDFGSALHEALTNSLCAVRWIQRQPAFPEDCREASESGDDADSGVMDAEGYFQ